MYRKKSEIINNKQNLSNYILDTDVYNSYLSYLLSSPGLSKEEYVITKYEYRPDLIAEDFYGSSKYLGLVMLQSCQSLSDFKRGTVLNLIPKSELDNLLNSI